MNLMTGLKSECKILMNRLYYLEKKTNDTRPKNLLHSGLEEEIEIKKRLLKYANDNIRRNILIKAYFTRLIFMLIHLFNINYNLKNQARAIKIKPQIRFKRKKQLGINNFEELILFFGDAIRHPEEEMGERSPRRSVKYNFLDENMFMQSFYDEHNKDVFFRMGDCEVSLTGIKNYFKII